MIRMQFVGAAGLVRAAAADSAKANGAAMDKASSRPASRDIEQPSASERGSTEDAGHSTICTPRLAGGVGDS